MFALSTFLVFIHTGNGLTADGSLGTIRLFRFKVSQVLFSEVEYKPPSLPISSNLPLFDHIATAL